MARRAGWRVLCVSLNLDEFLGGLSCPWTWLNRNCQKSVMMKISRWPSTRSTKWIQMGSYRRIVNSYEHHSAVKLIIGYYSPYQHEKAVFFLITQLLSAVEQGFLLAFEPLIVNRGLPRGRDASWISMRNCDCYISDGSTQIGYSQILSL